MRSKLTVLLSALFLVSVLGASNRAQSTDPAMKSELSSQIASIRENFVTVEKLRVRYVESGNGPTIVMIHGNAGSVEDFEFGAIETLSTNNRVIAVDRPGHGKSERPNRKTVDVEYQARLLHQVLSGLNVARPVLVGHSWGAALALSYALRYPTDVSGLILMAPAAYPDSGESRLLKAMSKPPVIGDVPLLLSRWILGRQILKSVLRRAFFPQPVPESYFQLVASSWLSRKHLKAYLGDESSLNTSLRKFSTRYSEISIPVVILTGDHDQIVSATENAYRLQDSIANAQLIELKNTGHEIPQTHPESNSNALNLIGHPSRR